jgi:hypothetical protein
MPEAKKTCCPARRKFVVGILATLPEEQCGVPDTEVAEFIRFDLMAPGETPVISFRYCPWCGTERTLGSETRITMHVADQELEDENDEWSSDVDTEAWEDDE